MLFPESLSNGTILLPSSKIVEFMLAEEAAPIASSYPLAAITNKNKGNMFAIIWIQFYRRNIDF
jgi:hypothetical protein